MEITYSKYGNYYLPDLVLSGEEPTTYGRFGRMTHHLNETDREANETLQLLIEQMAQAQGITEQLKAENQMAWVGAMNNIRNAVEEIVAGKTIYR